MPRKSRPTPKNKETLQSAQEKNKEVKKRKAPVKKKQVPLDKQRVPRTRNANTQTESSFWTMIAGALRTSSRWWKPALKTKERARRPYVGTNKLQKWEFQCNHCGGWFKDNETQIDHIVPVGSLKCGDDLKSYVERLFVEEGGWQILCTDCHKIKTAEDIANIRNKRNEESY